MATTRCHYWYGVGPQANKFEQVSSDDHKLGCSQGAYLRGVGMSREGWVCAEEDVSGKVCPEGVSLPCDLSHNTCDVTYSPFHQPPLNRMTDACKNITFQQLLLHTVTMY